MAFADDPSPKFQFQLVGVFVEWSVNVTVCGAMPDEGVPVKLEIGGFTKDGANIWIRLLSVSVT